jgi:hypothetical protein
MRNHDGFELSVVSPSVLSAILELLSSVKNIMFTAKEEIEDEPFIEEVTQKMKLQLTELVAFKFR